MDQNQTWHGGMPWPRPHCVRSSSPHLQSCTPIFGPCSLWLNGWMDQDATWYGSSPRPSQHCVRWGPSSPPPKKNGAQPHFLAHVLWSNGWIDQDATWYEDRPRPWPHCVRFGTAPKVVEPPSFRLMSVVAKSLDGATCHLVGRYTSAQAMC